MNALLRPVLATLVAILLAATMLAGGPGDARAADTPAAAGTQTLLRGYELEGFRWDDRTQVDVYYTWDGGPCVIGGSDLTGPASTLDPAVALATLEASLADINAQLRGGLTLVLADVTTRADLCSTTSGNAIVVGYGSIESTGLARLFGFQAPGAEFTTLTAARVFVSHSYDFACPDDPVYRDLQHLLTHELLHALGVDHTTDPTAIMAPVGAACEMASVLQPDDVAALAALYPPVEPAAEPIAEPTAEPTAEPAVEPTAEPTAEPTSGGGFDRVLTSSGVNTALWNGGSLAELDLAAIAAQGVSVSVFLGGQVVVYIPGAPSFVNAASVAAFPDGLPAGTIVLVVR